ncbi:MAG TPA: SDR family oxidoreductase [Miltoncostaeaceae bacterium]|nr:SDR family oxidoreductase [Miltoncostaeaceae bacterium]
MRLAEARILVAGATGGIGGALARALSAEGARLAVSGRDAGRLAAAAAATGGTPVAADLTDPVAPEMLVAQAEEALGGLDAVVCAIGVVAFGPAQELDDAVLRQLFAINALAPIRLTRAALDRLAPGGVVVNVSAVTADQPTAGMAAYSASKAALTAFDAAVHREVRRRGLRVLDVRPPHTETGLAGRPLAGEAPRLAAGRDPDEIARAVVAAMAADATEVSFGGR